MREASAAKPLRCFKGHHNTSKNFVRARFGPGRGQVVSGSEDGIVYVWDLESARLMQKLRGHDAVCYDAAWNDKLSVLASCSHDGSVCAWHYDPNVDAAAAGSGLPR